MQCRFIGKLCSFGRFVVTLSTTFHFGEGGLSFIVSYVILTFCRYMALAHGSSASVFGFGFLEFGASRIHPVTSLLDLFKDVHQGSCIE